MKEQIHAQSFCPKCNGSGWEPAEKGQGVRRCGCWETTRLDRLLADARIPRRYEHCDLESYLPSNPSQRNAKKLCASVSQWLIESNGAACCCMR